MRRKNESISLKKQIQKAKYKCNRGLGFSLSIKSCRRCRTMDCIMRMLSILQFTWSNGNINCGDEPNFRSGLNYDDETDEILIDEELLMQAIIFANPGQERRKLRLIPHKEFMARQEARRRAKFSEAAPKTKAEEKQEPQ